MPRSKPLNFIPISVNFSEIPVNAEDGSIEDVLPSKEDDLSGLWVENTIMRMMEELPSNRERVILLLQILRGNGYNFDQQSIANLFGVKLRWYMRVVQRIRRKLACFNRA